MGMFVNPDNSAFQVALNSEIYVDKTGLIKYTNNYCRSQKPYVQTRLTIFAARYLAGGFIGGASQSGAERKLLYGICEPHCRKTVSIICVVMKDNKAYTPRIPNEISA